MASAYRYRLHSLSDSGRLPQRPQGTEYHDVKRKIYELKPKFVGEKRSNTHDFCCWQKVIVQPSINKQKKILRRSKTIFSSMSAVVSLVNFEGTSSPFAPLFKNKMKLAGHKLPVCFGCFHHIFLSCSQKKRHLSSFLTAAW
jgi:hypothetical protein